MNPTDLWSDPGKYSTMTQAQKDALASAKSTTTTPIPTKPVTILSTEHIIPKVNEIKAQAEKLVSDFATFQKEENKKENAPTITETTGITPEQREEYKTKYGLTDEEVSAELGGVYAPQIAGERKAISELELASTKFSNEMDALKKRGDEIYNAQLESIKATFAQNVRDMEDLNTRREQVISTTGIRGGATRYAKGIQEGLMTTEIEAGKNRIGKIRAAEVEATNTLKQATLDNDYEKLFKTMDYIKELRNEENTHISNINSLLQKQSDEIQKEKDAVIEEQKKKQEELQNKITSILVEVGKNNPPPEVIDAISSSSSVGDAIKAAGEYMQSGGTGIVAEYNFYKKDALSRGLTPVDFDTYQNQDENRKKSIASAANAQIAGSELDTKSQAVFNKLVEKYNSSEAIKALDRAYALEGIISEIEKNPNNATDQLNLIYSYIKALDTNSAVREGEISLVQSINSYLGKFQLAFDKITSGKPVSGDVAKQIAESSRKLVSSIKNVADKKKATFDAQARANGTKVYNAWTGFTGEIASMPDTSSSVQESADIKRNKIIEYGKTNKNAQSSIEKMISDGKTDDEIIALLGLQ